MTVTPAFGRGLERATDAAGNGFADYVLEAQTTYREAAKRTTEVTRDAVIPAGKGLDPKLRRVLRDELPELRGKIRSLSAGCPWQQTCSSNSTAKNARSG